VVGLADIEVAIAGYREFEGQKMHSTIIARAVKQSRGTGSVVLSTQDVPTAFDGLSRLILTLHLLAE
jgi:hypothetical protein